MKTYVYVIATFLLLVVCGCSKVGTPSSLEDVSNYPESVAMEDFAAILSKAVSGSQDVREFLRDNALEQMDKDYDVFYPFVRDEKINGNCSFREYLVSCSDEKTLQRIEQRLPLLTIYVPDLTWLEEDAFSVNSWDVSSNEVLVCSMDEEGTRHFYFEGKEEISLKRGEGILFGPFLIVKNNERIVVSGATKAGDASYSFISPVFDGRSAEVKGGWRYQGNETNWTITTPAPDASDYISAADLNRICPDAIRSYNEFKSMPNSAQRDYPFYGMTATNSNGVLNHNVKDRIFRFKVAHTALMNINDTPDQTTTHVDPLHFVDGQIYAEIDDNGHQSFVSPSTYESAMELLVNGGRYEFEITTYYGKSTNARYERLYIDAGPRDLFEFTKIKKTEYGATWVKWYRVWVYRVNIADVAEKWYYPNDALYLPPWNLYDGSTSVHLEIKEIDSEETKTYTHAVTNTVTTGHNEKITTEEKHEYGYSTQFQVTDATTYQIVEKLGSDELGELAIGYVDPYIRTATPTNNPSRYLLKSYSTGKVTISFLPEKLVY